FFALSNLLEFSSTVRPRQNHFQFKEESACTSPADFRVANFWRMLHASECSISLAMRIPLPALAAELADDPRISQTPLVDKGFAAVRRIANGLYATISDFSKGSTTVCNGGVLLGKDAARLIEGFPTPSGAAPQTDALRMGSPGAVTAALATPDHLHP